VFETSDVAQESIRCVSNPDLPYTWHKLNIIPERLI